MVCGVSLTCDKVLNGCYERLSIPGSHQVGLGLQINDELIITPQTDNVAHTVQTRGSYSLNKDELNLKDH